MTHFRPISLCNVIYKIISKVLVNRLKHVLPDCISENQSAFVPGRLITDNLLVAYELLHTLKHRKGHRNGHFALKLDMSKAYDRVEWSFLEGIMLKMGFATRWVDLIMNCVKTVSFSIIVNGEVTNAFAPERGLRQGDPLSPYLFLMCTEGLSALLASGQHENLLQGVYASRNGPRVNHLFFADDSLLFGKANGVESREMMNMLRKYEEGSGQKINYDKSAIFFSNNTSDARREEVKAIFGVREQQIIEKYLGLPAMVGRNRRQAFVEIKDRIAKKLHHWSYRMLSQGGREVMIKSVLQAIPTYTMNVFALPKSFCEINSMVGRFWWKQCSDKRPIHWLSWQQLCRSKDHGGLGFREMEKFNVALLAKQGWRLLQCQSSLMFRVLKARYFPRTSFMEAKVGWNPSFTWKSIWSSRRLLQQGLRWRVGNGVDINVLNDSWVPGLEDFRPTSAVGRLDPNTSVAELINADQGTWNREFIASIFSDFEAQAIFQIPLSKWRLTDARVWHFDNKGYYTVRSGYRVLCNLSDNMSQDPEDFEEDKHALRQIWSADVPPKVRIFGWRMFHDILPVMNNLLSRNMEVDPLCFRCKQEPETLFHAIKDCEVAAEVWRLVHQRFNADEHAEETRWFEISLVTAWAIWGARNKVLHEGRTNSPSEIAAFAFAYLSEFKRCQDPAIVTPNKKPVHWEAPPRDTIKINFDGAWEQTKKQGGFGVIARDSNGDVMGALAGKLDFISDSFSIEGAAAVKALEWAKDMGFTDIILEGDALSIIRKINADLCDFSPVGPYIFEAIATKRCFSHCQVLHVGREGNTVAHSLAKFGLGLEVDKIWIEEAPIWLLDFLHADCNFP